MSEEIPPAESQEIAETPKERVYPTDWGNDIGQSLTAFKKQGMPGLARVRPEDIFRMREMYLAGSSYREIAMGFSQKLALVVFLSEKEGWYKEKIEKAEMIAETLTQNYHYIKADNTLFVTELLIFWQNYYREQIKDYKRSKDKSIVERMDMKPLEKYFKAIELLEKLMTKDNDKDPPNPQDKPQNPLVNINMGAGSSMTESNGTLTLTPASAEKIDSSKVFELLAQLKEQQEIDKK